MGVEMEKVVLVTIRHSNTAASEALQGHKQVRTVGVAGPHRGGPKFGASSTAPLRALLARTPLS